MISVIICSEKDKSILRKLFDKSIGVSYELVVVKPVLGKGISEAYNRGSKMAKYEILCFCHDDIEINTIKWGEIVLAFFDKNPNLGLVGIAGSKYKSKTLSGWATKRNEFDCVNICHKTDMGFELSYLNPDKNQLYTEVITLDGVWMCVRSGVLEQISFDERLFNRFHVYDIDFSFRASYRWKAIVTYEIEIIHDSKGRFNNFWISDTINWHKKNKKKLPHSVINIDKSEMQIIEHNIKLYWMYRLRGEEISFYNKMRWIWYSRIGSIKELKNALTFLFD